jgi:hypothetical protein
LLDTIKEGFKYIEESFTNYERMQGDAVLVDIFTAFGRISQTNAQFERLFAADEGSVHPL